MAPRRAARGLHGHLRRPLIVQAVSFSFVASVVDGIPNMSRDRGRRVYDHLRETDSRDVLELGTAHGVSAAYMAAAVQDHQGRVTTVDHVIATRLRDPAPEDVLAHAGVADSVDRVLVEDSSYTWWLKDQIVARSDEASGCQPIYDFVYIDGAHNWTIDGFAFFLVEKLLRPGGWLLLDDLAWSYGVSTSSFGPGQGPEALGLSPSERVTPHMRVVFDLLVCQHPGFSNFRVEDNDWAWAQKLEGGRRSVEHVSTVGWRARVRSVAERAAER
jgi:predicted O-methyltransferase YrrM